MVTFRECYAMTSPHKGFEFITQIIPNMLPECFAKNVILTLRKFLKVNKMCLENNRLQLVQNYFREFQ